LDDGLENRSARESKGRWEAGEIFAIMVKRKICLSLAIAHAKFLSL
jgi:hypothetical protein